MKIQLTTNHGCANGVYAHQWFANLLDAQEYCETFVRKYAPAQNVKSLIEDIQDSNVKGLTNLMTNVTTFKFEWVE